MGRSIETVLPDSEGRYLNAEGMREVSGRALIILGARHEPAAKYGPRWVIKAALMDSGEVVLIPFAENQTRTNMFSALREGLDESGADAFDPVVLYQAEGKVNDFWTLRSATPEELAEAATAEPVGPVDDDAAAGGSGDATADRDEEPEKPKGGKGK